MAFGEIIGGQALGLVLGGYNDDRQRRQQEALTDIQMRAQKDMAKYNQELAMKTWEQTNYDAQKQQMEKAGLNIGLMYGGGGAGGGTVNSGGGGSAGSGTADGGAARTAIGMQLASQIALLKAQKENVEADTANKLAGKDKTIVEKIGGEIDNRSKDVEATAKEMIGSEGIANRYKWNADLDAINSEKANAEWETFKATGYQGKAFDDTNSLVSKAIKAGWDEAIEKAKGARIENNIAKAEQAVKEFEAGLAKQGIDPKSPWWIKIVGDLLDKIGLSPLKAIKDNM
nr:MAG: DNA pilot protein [Microvirus sp.]